MLQSRYLLHVIATAAVKVYSVIQIMTRVRRYIYADINECDTAPCPELAMCVNTIGGFECVCDGPGLTGDGTEICEGNYTFCKTQNVISRYEI